MSSIRLKCFQCKRGFLRSRRDIRPGYDRVYCSQKCQILAQRKERKSTYYGERKHRRTQYFNEDWQFDRLEFQLGRIKEFNEIPRT